MVFAIFIERIRHVNTWRRFLFSNLRIQYATCFIYGFRPSGQRCIDTEEFNIVCDLEEAINEERYKDAGILSLSLWPSVLHLSFLLPKVHSP